MGQVQGDLPSENSTSCKWSTGMIELTKTGDSLCEVSGLKKSSLLLEQGCSDNGNTEFFSEEKKAFDFHDNFGMIIDSV
jgi:hypothetical protein